MCVCVCCMLFVVCVRVCMLNNVGAAFAEDHCIYGFACLAKADWVDGNNGAVGSGVGGWYNIIVPHMCVYKLR